MVRRRLPKPNRRRMLELLAGSPTGCTEALLFAYGITVEMLVGLIEAGLATASAERMVAGSKAIEVARVLHHRGGAAGADPRLVANSACRLKGNFNGTR